MEVKSTRYLVVSDPDKFLQNLETTVGILLNWVDDPVQLWGK